MHSLLIGDLNAINSRRGSAIKVSFLRDLGLEPVDKKDSIKSFT